MAHNYASPICRYCACTDYGEEAVCTSSLNMCEGVGCEQALDTYNECHEEDEQFASLDDAF